MTGSASVPATTPRPVEWGVVLAIAVAALGYSRRRPSVRLRRTGGHRLSANIHFTNHSPSFQRALRCGA